MSDSPTPASNETERLISSFNGIGNCYSEIEDDCRRTIEHLRALQAENERLCKDLTLERDECCALVAHRDSLIAERDKYKAALDAAEKAMREALNNQRNCQDILREALEHFTDE